MLSYEIEFDENECIASGAFGKIFLGRGRKNGAPLAIKQIDDRIVIEQGAQAELASEISAHMAMQHPNILCMYGFHFDNHYTYIMMEYAAGGTLKQIIDAHLENKFDFPIGDIKLYIKAIINALEYCHKKNVIHRDLKPENIMIGQNNALKLCDFGLSARGLDDLNMRTTPIGTHGYIAPELYRPYQRRSEKTDCFSLGCVAFDMLTGQNPFDIDEELDTEKILRRIEEKTYAYPSEQYVSDVDAQAFVEKLLEPKPELRFSLYQARADRYLS